LAFYRPEPARAEANFVELTQKILIDNNTIDPKKYIPAYCVRSIIFIKPDGFKFLNIRPLSFQKIAWRILMDSMINRIFFERFFECNSYSLLNDKSGSSSKIFDGYSDFRIVQVVDQLTGVPARQEVNVRNEDKRQLNFDCRSGVKISSLGGFDTSLNGFAPFAHLPESDASKRDGSQSEQSSCEEQKPSVFDKLPVSSTVLRSSSAFCTSALICSGDFSSGMVFTINGSCSVPR